MVVLPYGSAPYPLALAGREATIIEPATLPAPAPLDFLIEDALARPIGRPVLETLVGSRGRVTVIISDSTRNEPRAAFLAAIRRRLPDAYLTIAIATGTHGPADLHSLGLPDELLAGVELVNHDGHRDDGLVDLGVTARGTPIRLHRCVVDTDLVIATGCIRPHYFAGFGAGVKAVFPGLGAATAIRRNHALKTAPRARAGITDGNPCREDLEEAVRAIATPMFLVNGVCGPDGLVHAVVAGDLVRAFRDGAARARRWFSARAPRAPIVVGSDALPVTASLYQAAKIAAACAPLVEEDGALVVVAECPDGIGPLDVVNEKIFRIGVLPRLPRGASIHLVSGLSSELVAGTLVRYAASVAEVLSQRAGRVVVVPNASQLILEPTS
ncbi:MAG TPA: lactate racemase domain-containing protein [Kofleriaceae bacterium]|jgi:nickel-dependent lactate racemase|nr:lactate racemase domain-containing protein [Kofleriaceae bacterium]